MEDKPKSFFSLKHALRFCRTVRYLEFQQVFYRLFYPIKKLYYIPVQITAQQLEAAMRHRELTFAEIARPQDAYDPCNNTFTFLNITKSFGTGIDWDFKEFGLLWSFHLHYFDWLLAPQVYLEKGLGVINEYIDKQYKGYFFYHSYITSYRIVSWIRFCTRHKVKDEKVFGSLYRQSQRLASFPEYELMGNHLMENGIALVWAGLFFEDRRLLGKGERILQRQFRRQILKDGVHFEKSYAYHTILLKRLLELAQFYKQFPNKDKFYNDLIYNCSKMLSHVIVLNDSGNFPPLFGDSNEGMSVPLQDLMNLAQNLPLKTRDLPLGESGLRKLEGEDCTVFFNLGNIPASYQPGHTHADAFTFCLNVQGRPLLVDRGVSTYEPGGLRRGERSTAAHNTVFMAGADSSEVWASFRVGKRTRCNCLVDGLNVIEYEHNGYFYEFKILHRRSISVDKKNILINDTLKGWKGQDAGIAFHFYPGLEPQQNQGGWDVDGVRIEVEGADMYLEDYEYAKDFNLVLPARRIVGIVQKENIRTTIVLR